MINWKYKEKNITYLSLKEWIVGVVFSVLVTYIIYIFNTHIHIWAPTIFKHKADFPIIDSIIAGFSIVATILIAHKKIDSWKWFVAIDLTASVVYLNKELYLTALLFIAYAILAIYAIKSWKKKVVIAS